MDAGTGIPLGAGAHIDNAVDEQMFYLPLVDHEGAFLPLHFTSENEVLMPLLISLYPDYLNGLSFVRVLMTWWCRHCSI